MQVIQRPMMAIIMIVELVRSVLQSHGVGEPNGVGSTLLDHCKALRYNDKSLETRTSGQVIIHHLYRLPEHSFDSHQCLCSLAFLCHPATSCHIVPSYPWGNTGAPDAPSCKDVLYAGYCMYVMHPVHVHDGRCHTRWCSWQHVHDCRSTSVSTGHER